MQAEFLRPGWPAPEQVRALSTARLGGVSQGAYASFNLGEHVGDLPASVSANRTRLQQTLGAVQPRWLKQVHGTRVAMLNGVPVKEPADASIASQTGVACVVMTADCLPVIFCDRAGTRVAAAHAGWRGLAAGVLEETVEAMGGTSSDIMAWMGPAIGPQAYEVGDEVRQAFVGQSADAAVAFKAGVAPGKWWCDLYTLARQRLAATGVTAVYGGGSCTFTDKQRFFSHRRDGQTGRMATLVWLE